MAANITDEESEDRGTRSGDIDEGWWSFSIHKVPQPPHYHTYLQLDKLLGCQNPSSMVPDERNFIVVHQLFELTFKLMVFDLAVVAATFEELISIENEDEFRRKSLRSPISLEVGETEDDKVNMENFWRPALNASARLELSSKTLFPVLFRYLSNGEETTFSGVEFYYFRKNLEPASAFQTAQFRLIQRSLGKAAFLDLRMFPGKSYGVHYRDPKGENVGWISAVDPLILGEGAGIASPSKDSPRTRVTRLDELAHDVLKRLSLYFKRPAAAAPGDSLSKLSIGSIDLEAFSRVVQEIKDDPRRQQKEDYLKWASEFDTACAEIQLSWRTVIEQEEKRRRGWGDAVKGASFLKTTASDSNLAKVLNRLVTVDDALHSDDDSFLRIHSKAIGRVIRELKDYASSIGDDSPPKGTGGGGEDYLDLSLRLVRQFPALIAYRNGLINDGNEEGHTTASGN